MPERDSRLWDAALSAAEAEVHAEPWRCIKIRPRRSLRRRGRDCLPCEELLITACRPAAMCVRAAFQLPALRHPDPGVLAGRPSLRFSSLLLVYISPDSPCAFVQSHLDLRQRSDLQLDLDCSENADHSAFARCMLMHGFA